MTRTRKKQLKKARKWRWDWVVEREDTRLLYKTEYNGRYANMA